MAELRRGEREALARLYQAYFKEVYRFCLRMLRDPHRAEEACQETFLDLYRAARTYEAKGNFRGFLYTLAINRCRKELNRMSAAPVALFPNEEVDGELSPEEIVMEREVFALMEQTFALLPANQRFALTLVVGEGLSYEEAARALSVTVSQIKTWVFRGREVLRRAIGDLPSHLPSRRKNRGEPS